MNTTTFPRAARMIVRAVKQALPSRCALPIGLAGTAAASASVSPKPQP